MSLHISASRRSCTQQIQCSYTAVMFNKAASLSASTVQPQDREPESHSQQPAINTSDSDCWAAYPASVTRGQLPNLSPPGNRAWAPSSCLGLSLGLTLRRPMIGGSTNPFASNDNCTAMCTIGARVRVLASAFLEVRA